MQANGGTFERPPRSGVWWIDYQDAGGKRHREKIGRKVDARAAYERRVREVTDGNYVPPRIAGRAATFASLVSTILQQKRSRLRKQSYETDVRRLTRATAALGKLHVEQVTPQVLDKFLRGLKDSGLSGSTVNRFRASICSIYSIALKQGIVKSNPILRVERFKENPGRLRYLLDDEEERLLTVIRDRYPKREPELLLALYSGMRRGEQFTLKWADVDLASGNLTVRGKSDRRHVVLNSGSRRAIELLRADRKTEYVCPETQNDEQRDWRRWFEKSVKAAGIKNFRYHDLRHTYASRLVMRGVDIRTVQVLCGHASIEMTMRYAHLSPDHRQAAAEKIVGKE